APVGQLTVGVTFSLSQEQWMPLATRITISQQSHTTPSMTQQDTSPLSQVGKGVTVTAVPVGRGVTVTAMPMGKGVTVMAMPVGKGVMHHQLPTIIEMAGEAPFKEGQGEGTTPTLELHL